jgi:UDP-N-acetylmuramoylalanine--D-glutamate ligase
MRISDAIGRKVGLLGFGLEGRSVLDVLRRRGHREIVHVIDDKPVEVPEGAQWHPTSALPLELRALDVVVRSPGFSPQHPFRRLLDQHAVTQTTATRLFLRELRERSLPVVGITGSKGKSTTASLTYLTLEASGMPTVLVGNVGVPALDMLERIEQEKLHVVMELSSYQCSDLEDHFGPGSAGLLDLFPEHLDWHGSLEAYYAAKLRIITAQRAQDVAFYNPVPAELAAMPSRARAMNVQSGLHFASGWFLRGRERLFSDQGMLLLGTHNRQNAIAALALSEPWGARPEHLREVLQRFRGLPFRLQNEGAHAGITWFNDAISTAPDTVAAALAALSGAFTASTLIVGGQRRGLDQTPLAEALAASTVRTLIVMPDTGSDVARAVRARALPVTLLEADTLEDAVAAALSVTPQGHACLFSPGAPSYHRYKSFQERGAHLRRLLDAL